MTKEEATTLYKQDVKSHVTKAHTIFGKTHFDSLPKYLKISLVDGVFQGIHKTSYASTKAIIAGEWKKAADNINRGKYNKDGKANPAGKYDKAKGFIYQKDYALAIAADNKRKKAGKAAVVGGTRERFENRKKALERMHKEVEAKKKASAKSNKESK